jgi:hypothetical protein
VIIPLPAVLQSGSIMRQPLAAAPFVAFLAALPLAALWRMAGRSGRLRGAVAAACVAVALALIATITVRDYFWRWRDDPWVRFIYFSEMSTASTYIDRLPPEAYVLFYSERASIDLETRQFLAPDARGEDRSSEFSGFDGSIEVPDRSRPTVFVLLGRYIDLIAQIEERYPGGVTRTASRDGKLEFISYELPAEPG